MPDRHSDNLLAVIPVLAVLYLLPEARSGWQTCAVVLATLATSAGVLLAARWVWTPLLRKIGFWPTSLTLGTAILLWFLAGVAIALGLGARGFVLRLTLDAVLTGLLFSWVLATLRGARAAKSAAPSAG